MRVINLVTSSMVVSALMLSGCATILGSPEPPATWVPLPTLGPTRTQTPIPPTPTVAPSATPVPSATPPPATTPAPTVAPHLRSSAAGAAWSRDRAWTYLLNAYPDERLPKAPGWARPAQETLPVAERYRFVAKEWALITSVPMALNEQAEFAVRVLGPEGYRWDAVIRGDGAVTASEPMALPAPVPVEGWPATLHSLPGGSANAVVAKVTGGQPGEYGVIGADAAVQAELERLRDQSTSVWLYGRLQFGLPEESWAELTVERFELLPEATATLTPRPTSAATRAPASEVVEGWEGQVRAAPAGSGFDDLFVRQRPAGQFGIAGLMPQIEAEIAAARQAGVTIRIWGVLDYGVADLGGSRITVSRIERISP